MATAEQPPSWLVAVGGVFALALWAAPIAVSRAAGVNFGLGMLIGGLLAASVLVGNTLIVFLVRVSDSLKVALLAGVALVGLGMFFTGAYVAAPKQSEETVEAPPQPPPEPPPPPPPAPKPITPVPPVPPVSERPPSHIDLAQKDGMTRLEDGPAPVTALALTPNDAAAVIGHSDGSIRILALDQPTFEPAKIGPKGDGAVRRIQFDATGRIVYLTCDGGFIAAQLYNAVAHPLKIPGDRVVILADPKGDRFAAYRGNKLIIRYVPIDLVKTPPMVKAPERFVVCNPKQELLPAGVKPEYPLPENAPTFLTFHPGGQLIYGRPEGTVRTWSVSNIKPEDASKEHKGAVNAWTANGSDFATGDEKGTIAYWKEKPAKPVMYWNGKSAIAQLSFSAQGTDLLVSDVAGGLSGWDVSIGKRKFEMFLPESVAATSYGPTPDLLLLADSKGVQLWTVKALLEKVKKPAKPIP